MNVLGKKIYERCIVNERTPNSFEFGVLEREMISIFNA